MAAKLISVSPKTRVGWIGTGIMGATMCGHLMTKGWSATIFNRTKSKAKSLLDKDAHWADSPKAVAAWSDVIFSIIGFPKDVREVYFGERGILAGAKRGSIIVDMTTTEPSLAEEIHEAAKAKGVFALDAPVSGGDVGARNATLSIMIGGEQRVMEAVRPMLETMGKTIYFHGSAGSGQRAKLCNQIAIAHTMMAVCETLLFAYKAGLNLEKVLGSVRGGAAGSRALETLAPRMLKRDFEPGFMVDHFIKDMGIALDEARRMKIVLPGLALVQQLYLAAQAQGHGRRGTQALLLALEQLSRMEIKT